MSKEHRYEVAVHWTGSTSGYTSYSRNHEISVPGKPPIAASSDSAFRGDPARYNPEEMLVAALSTCHMLWYLHLCAEAGIVVIEYADAPFGLMREDTGGGGVFTKVELRPVVTIARGSAQEATRLHDRAHDLCYIARSVNFPVHHEATIKVQYTGAD
jgi:organic hydroperoxide reductase OsmC/OhrA